jgi:fructoselysine-6-phosphate deglycase
MLNFDADRFLRIQSGAVAQVDPIVAAVEKLLDGGARNVVFLGTGGAGILMGPAYRLLQTRSTFPAYLENPAELLTNGSVALGPGSIVVIPSLSGTTRESVAALEKAQEAGATVLVLTGHADTPLAQRADHAFVNFAEDDTSCEMFFVQSLAVALTILDHRGEVDDWPTIRADLDRLPSVLVEVKEAFEDRAVTVAEALASADYHIVTGAGSSWWEAFYYGMCILEEMQWIRTRPVHASDFFHGTLELLEPGVSVVVLKGEDGGRALCERVEAFAQRYTDRLTVLDTAELELPGISPSTRELLSPVLLATVLERVSAHLEVMRDHPLTTRRYYKRVEY